MSFNSKWFISNIHWISTGGNQNPKPNPKPNPNPNLKTVGEKPTPNPKPEKPKPADTRTEPDLLPSLVVHDRVCGYTYSFHPTGAVHLYPLSLMPAENDPTDSEAPVYYHKTNGYDTILFPQFGSRKRLHKVVRPPSLAIRGVSRPVPPQ